MFCHKCGKEIDDDAVVCIHCGVDTKNMQNNKDKSINIVNQASASSSSKARVKRGFYCSALDVILLLCTGGFWLIVMLLR